MWNRPGRVGRRVGSKLRIVEFFGLPGSGKTTNTDLLAGILRAGGQVAFTHREIYEDYPWPTGWGKLLRVFMGAPGSWATVGRALTLQPPPGSQSYRFRRAIQLPRFAYPLERIRARHPGAAVILDQWMAHAFCGAVLDGKMRRDDARRMLRAHLQRYDVVYVHLELDCNIAAARVAARSRARTHDREDGCTNFWDGVDEQVILGKIRAFGKGFSALKEELDALGAPVATIDATQSPSVVCEAVLDRFGRFLRRGLTKRDAACS
jgi:RecA/RadA recombinase